MDETKREKKRMKRMKFVKNFVLFLLYPNKNDITGYSIEKLLSIETKFSIDIDMYK